MRHLTCGILAVILLAGTGCAHSLMKGSPFYTGSVMVGIAKGGEKVRWDDPEAAEVKEITLADVGGAELAADRVNVWPMFYHNLLITSILWPMAEVNDVGWKVRPLVSVDRYREEYRVLLGGWHGKTDTHYVVPLYFRKGNDFASLLYVKDGNRHLLPPLLSYWRPGHFGILYPLSDVNTRTGESHVIPLYIKDEDGWYTLLAGSGKDFRYVLPPLLIMTGTDGDQPGYHACWPLFSLTPTEKKCYSFPLFSYNGQTDPDGDWAFNYLWPLGWTGREGSTTHAAFFPLLGYESDEMLITPLGGWLDDGDTVLVVPPLYIRDRDSRGTDHNLLWPFGNLRIADREKDPAAAAIQGHFFPIFAHYRDAGSRFRLLLFPLYMDYEEQGESATTTWRWCFPVHYGYNSPTCRHANWGMLAGTKTETIAGEPRSSAYLLPFYYHDWEAEATWRPEKNAEGEEEWIRHETATETRFILPGILTSSNVEKRTSTLTILPVYSGRREGDQTSHSSLLWLFTRKADLAAGTVNAQALWYLVSYDRQAATGDLPATTNTRILWKLYHRERHGDEVNTDIFPFIACSRSPEHSRLSFAWRFFSIDRTPDATRVHLLFLPVWW